MKDIVPSEVNQRKINTVLYHLFVESKKSNKLMKRSRFTDTENKRVVTSWERKVRRGRIGVGD